MQSNQPPRYITPPDKPPLFHRLATLLAGRGITVMGCRVLHVRGRVSGKSRTALVSVQPLGGDRYLVAPRGNTQWVRNLRKAGGGQLQLGRRFEAFTAEELPDEEKVAVLRPYMKRWRFERDEFFEGVHHTAPDTDLLRIAPNHPVFRLHPARVDG